MIPIITSLLDTDLYKLTMLQIIVHKHPTASAEYAFRCRNTPAFPIGDLKAALDAQLDSLCTLRFTQDELDFLAKQPYFKPDFIDFLADFGLKRKYISVLDRAGELVIRAKGPMVQTMLFEIYVLSLVNELYFQKQTAGRHEAATTEGERRLSEKIGYLKDRRAESAKSERPFVFFDFGTRRRYSRAWQEHVVKTLAQEIPEFFKGTSNMDLARRLNLQPIGTMAHEYLQAYQAFSVRLRDFQKAALDDWAQEYRGELGIALTDVVGMSAFLRDFDLFFTKLYDGLRHDSGDPVVWGDAALEHYAASGVFSGDKRFVFSDGLSVAKAWGLWGYFAPKIHTGFGVGTNLTNDVGEVPLEIVMKLVSCNDQPVAKLSDSPGKVMCENQDYVRYLSAVFNDSSV